MDKIIKTQTDYETALSELDMLIQLDPLPGTEEADRLELLAVLLQDYESKQFVLERPDPVDAIKFRMEQQGLTQRDMVPFLGSRSKVSEILSRQRPLTLPMIRSLHAGLGIPTDVLIQEDYKARNPTPLDLMRFPIKEMRKRGWFSDIAKELQGDRSELMRQFLAPINNYEALADGVLFRTAIHLRSTRTMDIYALTAWTLWITKCAIRNLPINKYAAGSVDLAFMRNVALLSRYPDGPLRARDYLWEHGIALQIAANLPQTYVDGAAIMYEAHGLPIIGMSLRYDRLDNFWFCLMHELAHIALHLGEGIQFYDDLEIEDLDDPREREADEYAREALIPKIEWERSTASKQKSLEAAQSLAKKLQISPAIVAGRMRHEFKTYRLLSSQVGYREVRRWFPEFPGDAVAG